MYGHIAPSHIHNSALDGPTARSSSFAVGNEQLPRIHGNQGHASRVRLSQQDKQGVSFPLPPVDDNCLPQKDPFTNTKVNSQISEHPIISLEMSDGQILANDTVLRLERKRKVCNGAV